jgi:glycyl-radical enzyme activating protein family
MTGQLIKHKEETAVIFDIQSFSLQDGPGIRTTVFFKGCPLRCRWCHNPESLSAGVQLMYHPTVCVNCLQCVAACPNKAHLAGAKDGRLIHDLDWSRCRACGLCLKVCNYDALSLVGETYTDGQLCERLNRDLHYYSLEVGKTQKVQGGITFSGGEPMLHVAFMKAVRARLPEVHIALETSGYAPTASFAELGRTADLFLFDYKATNPNRHRELCGKDNRLILTNLDYLCRQGYDLILRLPLIPQINDDDEHLRGIAHLLKTYPEIRKAQIMPYHNLGINKRNELGMPPQTWGGQGAGEKVQQAWLKRLHELGADNIEISK